MTSEQSLKGNPGLAEGRDGLQGMGDGERAGLWLVPTSFIFPKNVACFPP